MLNLGVTIALRDAFTAGAHAIENSVTQLYNRFQTLQSGMSQAMYDTWNGLSLTMRGVAMMSPAVFSIKQAADYEYQIHAIQTVWEYAGKSASVVKQKVDELNDALMRQSRALGTDPVQTAQAYYSILQANINDTTEALHILELAQKSAIGGLTSVDDATRGLVAIRNAYKLTKEEMTKMTDQLFQSLAIGAMNMEEFNRSLGETIGIIHEAGIKLDEYFAMKATATLTGMTASQADTGIRQALNEIGQNKTKEAYEMINQWKGKGWLPKDFEFNISYMNKVGGLQPFVNMLYNAAAKSGDLNENLQKLFNNLEAKSLIFAIAGKQAKTFAQVLDEVRNKSAGALDRAFKIMYDSVKEKWNQLIAAGKRLFIEFGMPLLKLAGIVLTVAIKIVDAITVLLQKFPFLSYVIAGFIFVMGALFTALGLALVYMGMVRIATIALQLAFGAAGRSLSTSIGMMIMTLGRLFPLFMVLMGLFYILREAWRKDIGGIRSLFTGFFDNVALVFRALREVFGSMKGHIGYLSDETYNALQKAGLLEFVVTLVMWGYRLQRFWKGLKEGFKDAFEGLKQGIMDMLNSSNPVVRKIGETIMKVVDWLSNLRPKKNTGQWWEDLGQKIGKVVFWILLVIGAIKSLGAIFTVLRWGAMPFIWIGRAAMFAFRILMSIGRGVWLFIRGIFMLGRGAWTVITWAARGLMLFVRGLFLVGRGVWFMMSLVMRGFMWVIGIVASIIGLPAEIVAAIVIAVGVLVAIIIAYWDEIKQWGLDMWDSIKSGASACVEGVKSAWNGIVEWFTNNIVNPIKKAWDSVKDFFGIGGSKVTVNVNKGGDAGGGKGGKPAKMATGGYIPHGREGLAYLHENELVINSPTYNKLRSFLDRQLMNKEEEDDKKPTTPRYQYMQVLSEHKTRDSNEEGMIAQLTAQLQQMTLALQALGQRPIQLNAPLVVNGKEIMRIVYDGMKEKEARRY